MKKATLLLCFIVAIAAISCRDQEKKKAAQTNKKSDVGTKKTTLPPLDTALYSKKVKALVNGDTTRRWPVSIKPYPVQGAILPFKRIIAYYGNLYSKKMGILGELPPKELWTKLDSELAAWRKADPTTPVLPAIHYIAVVASGNAGKDGKYRTRMPQHQIDSALAIAAMHQAIVFLDIQVALSNVQSEVPLLEKYLKMPHVHLGIDPEFSMKDGSKPGKKIGTMNETDINFCTEYLAKIVKKNNLPAKILIVHRFTQGMVKNYKAIKRHAEVQLVMNMDGWGEPDLKRSTYKLYIYKEPVQFTGFKLFYKNDIKKAPHQMLTPADLMLLKPRPIYIQYQ